MKKRLLYTLSALLFIFIFVLPVAAQDPIRPDPVPPIPFPPEWDFRGLTIEYQRVETLIENQVATTHIDQLFVNNNDWMLEGTYLFPLPPGAAVSELTMWVDGVPIESKILEADEAREIYDQIVRQLRDPALLEYVGSSAIQANVFPIPPNDERRIEIEYSQVLPAENGLIHYTYPQTTDLYTNTPLDNQSIRVEVLSDEEIRAIYSPSHPVSIDRDGNYRALVGYEATDVIPEQDFELYYTVSPEDIGLNLLSYKETGQDGFFLMLVSPTVESNPDEIVAKDVILVLDTSGSMSGEKLAQAQDAVAFVVDNLNNRDRFNIISFSTGVRSYTRDLVPASEPGNYESFIDNLEAIGGTNISGALLEAIAQADSNRPTTILFLTDGLATEGIIDTSLLLDTIRSQSEDNVRIFAFGVGDDVDTLLLDSLVQDNSGATTYVRPGQQIAEAVSSFYAKISTPVLANVDLDFDNIIVEQIYPRDLPDLFAGTQLVLTGRYRDGGPATITLSGDVNGQNQTFIYEDNNFRNSGGDDFIPRLWATRAVGNLLTQIRLHGEDSELVQSVIDLSIRYGIITPYTSYLIEEDDIFTQTGRDMIMEESILDFAAPAEVSGHQAVAKAVEEAEMAAAEAPLAEPRATMVSSDGSIRTINEVVQSIGSKTFVSRDGVWIDTSFDQDQYSLQQVGFASDSYFELLSAAPTIGQYLATGPRVLVLFDGVAYEIVEGDGQSAITLPDSQTPDMDQVTDGQSQGTDLSDNTPGVPQIDDGPITSSTNSDSTAQPGGSNNQASAPKSGICASIAVAPLLMVGLAVVIGKRHWIQHR